MIPQGWSLTQPKISQKGIISLYEAKVGNFFCHFNAVSPKNTKKLLLLEFVI